jgi:hypothetical protein
MSMNRMASVAAIALGLAAALPARAAIQEEGGPAEVPDCGHPAPISRAMLAGASFSGGRLQAGGAYLVATLSSRGRGTLLFLRGAHGRWRGYGILSVSSILGVSQDRRSSDVFVWAWNDAEGPGDSFTGMHVSGTGGGRFCVTLDFPRALNQPTYSDEFLQFVGFNIAPGGRGIVVGTADVERGGRTRHWVYRYDSTDFGRTWKRPVRVGAPPGTPGTFRRTTGAAPTSLVRSLMAEAR